MSADSSSTPNNWVSWFNNRESAEKINKSNQEKLFSTFDASILKSDCIEAISTHIETVYLMKENFGTKRVNLFHHLIVVGGTLYDSSTKEYGFIQGLGEKNISKHDTRC